MVGIKSSGGANFLQRLLGKAQEQQNKSLRNLSTGEKSFISDVAAGAIAEALDAEVATRSTANRNINDFVSVANLRDSALTQISNIQDRQAELATQAANGTLSDEQRQTLDLEFQANQQEIARIASTTTFNGINLFEGTSAPEENNAELVAQVGTDGSASSRISLSSIDISSLIAEKSIGTVDDARTSIDSISTERTSLASIRSEDGAAVRRLEAAADNNSSTAEALAAARSRLRDVDVAEESANLVRNQILTQAGVATNAQANLNQQVVLNLLR